ncbi:Deoxyribonuclease-1-like 2 [Tupaia chinensis]|uniref:Deoxyribonuclease n=1 Tax=Tupaia chinensis TaxID=246437 RepID=L9L350_TUPCH|nr:Deoxyribonuclease-1-like 2 [Tupaia chinensis]
MGGPRVLLVTLWALGAAGAAALRIGAFNVQSFGDNKVSDPACSRIIAQILAGYDVALVQEVRDPDLSAVSALMELINSVSKHEYSFVSSEPLGRDQYKEMYLFVYRKNSVSAVAEIDALYDVYLDVIDKWGSDDMLFLGDFNADCSYVRAQDWGAIRLRSSEVFRWLIPDSADTTVGNSDCAYDRIVACGARLRRSLKPHSALVHNFQEELGLDQTEARASASGTGVDRRLPALQTQPFLTQWVHWRWELSKGEVEGALAVQQHLRPLPLSLQALAVSDHFPVEVTLKSH